VGSPSAADAAPFDFRRCDQWQLADRPERLKRWTTMMHLLGLDLAHLLSVYGYLAVGLVVGLESMGVPLPGETTLLTAAIYAGSTHRLGIAPVVLAAATGAVLGDNLGFLLGREVGYRLLLRYGGSVGFTERRLKLGQYLFLRHGGKVVFFGRFTAVLRTFAAVLAGANRMPWSRFLLFNAAGGVLWAALYGFGGFFVGEALHRLAGVLGIGIGVAGVVATVAAGVFLRRHETRLADAAERALPGPLEAPGRRRVGRGLPALLRHRLATRTFAWLPLSILTGAWRSS
jgi:membrane protein DedA with SNARE-associated domain